MWATTSWRSKRIAHLTARSSQGQFCSLLRAHLITSRGAPAAIAVLSVLSFHGHPLSFANFTRDTVSMKSLSSRGSSGSSPARGRAVAGTRKSRGQHRCPYRAAGSGERVPFVVISPLARARWRFCILTWCTFNSLWVVKYMYKLLQ